MKSLDFGCPRRSALAVQSLLGRRETPHCKGTGVGAGRRRHCYESSQGRSHGAGDGVDVQTLFTGSFDR